MSAEPSVESLPGAPRMARLLMIVASIIGGSFLLFGGFCFWNGWSDLRAAKERTAIPVRLRAGETVQRSFSTAARFSLQVWRASDQPELAGTTEDSSRSGPSDETLLTSP